MFEIKLVLRNLTKLLIISLITTICLLVSQILFLQIRISSLGMQAETGTYDNIGTVRKNDTISLFDEIPEQIINSVNSSSYINGINTIHSFAGLLEEGEIIPSRSVKDEITNLAVFRAVISEPDHLEYYTVTPWVIRRNRLEMSVDIKKHYIGISFFRDENNSSLSNLKTGTDNPALSDKNYSVMIYFDGEAPDLPEMKSGEEYLFFATDCFTDSGFWGIDQSRAVYGGIYECYEASDTLYKGAYPEYEKNPKKSLFRHVAVKIPNELSEEEKDAFVQEVLRDKGLEEYAEKVATAEKQITVRAVSDMRKLYSYMSERMYASEGRLLNSADQNEDVCIITKELAERNHWKLNDSISVQIGNGTYSIDGYPSGTPGLNDAGGDTEITYGERKEYQIIGILDYTRYDFTDALNCYSLNDIFVPISDDLPAIKETATPFNWSFSVKAGNDELFFEEIAPLLEKEGYELILSPSKWEEVSSVFTSIRERAAIAEKAIIVVLLTGIFLVCRLISILYRQEYRIRRIFGDSLLSAGMAYLTPLWCASLTGLVLSRLAFRYYLKTMQSDLERMKELGLSLNTVIGTECLLFAAGSILLMTIAMFVIAKLDDRRLVQ